jgi:ribosomal protein S18 acetylase RimI-like enzyme
MMKDASIRTNGPAPSATADQGRVVSVDKSTAAATLLLAFAADPGVRWMMPESATYAAGFPPFADAFGGAAYASGTALGTEDGRAVALWLKPGSGPDEQALVDVVERFASASRRGEVFELFERMGVLHPTEPHWHLPLIGTDPAAWGQGLGTKLMNHMIRRCQAEGLPIYLEATNERNVALYQRLGFGVVDVLRVGSSPPITPMLWRPSAKAT